jgi:hypothetical protein
MACYRQVTYFVINLRCIESVRESTSSCDGAENCNKSAKSFLNVSITVRYVIGWPLIL